MDAGRAIERGIALGEGAHCGEARQPRADRHHDADAGVARAREHVGTVGREVGEIEMAVAVDEHQALAAAASGGT
jgi:hypothetical protein